MSKKIYISIFIVSSLFVVLGHVANASMIYSQTSAASSVSATTASTDWTAQGLPLITASTTIGSLSLHLKSLQSGGELEAVAIQECTDSTCTAGGPSSNLPQWRPCNAYSTSSTCADVGTVYGNVTTEADYVTSFQYATYHTKASGSWVDSNVGTYGVVLSPGHYYRIYVGKNYNQVATTYGVTSDLFAGGACSIGCGGLLDLAFKVYDAYGAVYPPVVSTTVLNPAAGTFNVTGTWTASSTPCASQYLDVWQNTGLETHRELTLFNTFPLVTAPIYATSSGAFNFTFQIIDSSVTVGATSTVYTLTPNQQFYAQLYQSYCGYNGFTGEGVAPAQLVSTSTSLVAASSTVVEGGVNNNPFSGATYGTSTLPNSTDMLSFVNVPSLLATKVPFAYVFQVSSVIYNAVNGSTSASAIPSGSFSVKFPVKFGITGVATATTTINIDMFSTTTIGYFLTPSYVGLLRGLMVAVTYFLTAWYLFHEARNRKLL